MSYPTLIIGKSGAGKSASLRNLDLNKVALINVLGKPLPFKGGAKAKQICTDNYAEIISAIKRCKAEIIVIDDCGYLMTNQFMRGHSSAGAGNGVFTLYNQIGDNFFTLIDTARNIPGNKRIYFMMHEEMNDFGQIKPKSIGRMIDEKVCLEGMFTVCLRACTSDGRHIFRTVTDGADVAKAPIGMFNEDEIDNDLAIVDKAICEYYEIGDTKNDTAE